jgi:hypothetical protein
VPRDQRAESRFRALSRDRERQIAIIGLSGHLQIICRKRPEPDTLS